MRNLMIAIVVAAGSLVPGCDGSSDSSSSGTVNTSALWYLFFLMLGGKPAADGASVGYACNGHPLDWSTTDDAVLADEDEMLALLNARRAATGLPALGMHDTLRRCARGHSRHMAPDSHDFFALTDPEGRGPSDWLAANGLTGSAAECIGAGPRDDAFAAWISASGDADVLLAAGATEIGIGRHGALWTVLVR